MRILDFHAHLSDKWFDAHLIDESDFLDGLDRCGIEAACIFTLMGFYEPCGPHNDFLARRARAHPTRYIPFVTVDPKLGVPAVRELERCLSDPIFRGVKFHPWCQAFAPSMVKQTMIDILKVAAAFKAPVLFHDGTPPYSTSFQIAAAARWVPEATVVLGHGGLADYVVPSAHLTRDIPNLYTCVCCPKAGDVKFLVETAGADKVLWGSDFGIANWRLLAERLDDALFAGLDADTLDKVLYRNSAKLLQLNERPLKL